MLFAFVLEAQDTKSNYEQLWLDFMLHKTFNNGIRYLAEVGPRTLLYQRSGWSQFELSQNVQYNVFWNVDAIGGLLLNYTVQSDTTDLLDSYEVRPWTGARSAVVCWRVAEVPRTDPSSCGTQRVGRLYVVWPRAIRFHRCVGAT